MSLSYVNTERLEMSKQKEVKEVGKTLVKDKKVKPCKTETVKGRVLGAGKIIRE